MPNSPDDWERISKDFEEKWNFPNCLGALDGKHVTVQAPFNSGSYYYNYKHTHSVVLMALVDANYKFTYIDIGSNGLVSDGGVYRDCSLSISIEQNKLNFPDAKSLPGREKSVPYVIVADEAFPLKEYIMKPYPLKAGLDNSKRIFNYRLSRARRVVENAFGIICNRFRVLRSPMLLTPDKVESVVLCCCALHNFLRPESNIQFNESENTNDICNGLVDIHFGGNRSNQAREIRDEFKEYFCSVGRVPWQSTDVDH